MSPTAMNFFLLVKTPEDPTHFVAFFMLFPMQEKKFENSIDTCPMFRNYEK